MGSLTAAPWCTAWYDAPIPAPPAPPRAPTTASPYTAPLAPPRFFFAAFRTACFRMCAISFWCRSGTSASSAATPSFFASSSRIVRIFCRKRFFDSDAQTIRPSTISGSIDWIVSAATTLHAERTKPIADLTTSRACVCVGDEVERERGKERRR